MGTMPALLPSRSTEGALSCPLEPSVSGGMLPSEEKVPVHGEDARESPHERRGEALLEEELNTRFGMSTGTMSQANRSRGMVHRQASHKQGFRRVRCHTSY